MRPDEQLLSRLSALGLKGVTRMVTHTNRTVMLTLKDGVLRIHRGYAYAPDRVLMAIVRFLKPYTRRSTRKAMEQVFLGFPVDEFVPSSVGRRPDRPRPGDHAALCRLTRLHESLNTRYFDGRLGMVPVRLSGRMRRRLGELTLDRREGRPTEIAINRRHLKAHGWAEVEHTLLHEMIHQWQAETGRTVDHGTAFRRKAREVGVEPRAMREIDGRIPA